MTPFIALTAVVLVVLGGALNDRFHVGIGALAVAFVVGAASGLPFDQVAALFPAKLLLTLVGVTLLFALVETCGTLDVMGAWLMRLSGRSRAALPPAVFAAAALISAAGVGNIGATALMAPPTMVLCRRVGLSPFLGTILVVGGANAAACSPFAPTGVILRELLAAFGAADTLTLRVFAASFATQAVVHGVGFAALGGFAWWRAGAQGAVVEQPKPSAASPARQRIALALVVLFASLVVFGSLLRGRLAMLGGVASLASEIPACALVVVTLAMALRLAPVEPAIRRLPWSTLLLLVGMMTLVAVVEKLGGVDLATQALQRTGESGTLPLRLGLAAGALSAVSSSAGVVMPLFLPMVPALVGGGDPFGAVASVIVASHVVDCSPLSSLGALCLGAAADGNERARKGLFWRLMLWGLAMVPVGAVVCQLAFGAL